MQNAVFSQSSVHTTLANAQFSSKGLKVLKQFL
jgi:hypothetical protein